MWLVGIDYYDRDNTQIAGQSSSYWIGKIIGTSDGGDKWVLQDTVETLLEKVSFVKNW